MATKFLAPSLVLLMSVLGVVISLFISWICGIATDTDGLIRNWSITAAPGGIAGFVFSANGLLLRHYHPDRLLTISLVLSVAASVLVAFLFRNH